MPEILIFPKLLEILSKEKQFTIQFSEKNYTSPVLHYSMWWWYTINLVDLVQPFWIFTKMEGFVINYFQLREASELQNVDLLVLGGRGAISFPNVNEDFKCFSWTKIKLVLKGFLGNFKCFKLMFLFLRGGPKIQNFPNF